MTKFDPKSAAPVDVLVLGEHPSAYLAAALLRHGGTKPGRQKPPPLRVVHAVLPDAQPDGRLVTINPALFDLHPLLAGLRRGLPTAALHGLRFLADAGTASEYRPGSSVIGVTRYRQVRDAAAELAAAAGVESAAAAGASAVHVRQADETGLSVAVGKHVVRARALVLAGTLPADQQAVLGMPDGWGADVVHRFATTRCKAGKHFTPGEQPLMHMSLDLGGQLCWGWLIAGDGDFQLSVEQPLAKATPTSTRDLLAHWVAVLQHHGVLGPKFVLDPAAVHTVDLPLAGALAHEGVADRTLLVGPAGGFYSACGEDVYPGCWSALFAADVLRKALKEEHLQDALAAYRQVWRTTLGDYLRGPQQNLRLLLPLVYRNPVMTARLAEAILLSKSVVR